MEIKKEVQDRIKTPVKKAKTGISRFLFSRVTILLLLIFLQIAVIVLGTMRFSDYMRYFNAFVDLARVVTLIYILNEKSNPAFKLSWVLFIVIMPVFGLLFYLYMKLQPQTKYLGRRLKKLDWETKPYMMQNEETVKKLREAKPAHGSLAYYLGNTLSYPVCRNTEVTYFPSGEAKFEELKRQLRTAKKYIFMEYFIIDEGRMLTEVVDILRDKVREGVEVRFMYDGMRDLLLPYHFRKKLCEDGIRCKLYSPLRPVLTTYQNNRDHRKICVVDGRVAFTGGINLADEYINEAPRFGHWKDAAVMMQGEAVMSFTMMFLQMWNISEKKPEAYEHYLTPKSDVICPKTGYVIPYADSPFDKEYIGEQVYFHILNHAKRYVHIMTPYLILDNETITTITQAAKSGIEVQIIMPHVPDKWYAFVLAKTYYEELMQAGVQIYEYTPGFVHAKVFVSDDDTAVVGTVNLDYRSFYHHFECGAFFYDNPAVGDVERDFQETLAKCRLVTEKDLHSRSLFSKLIGRVLRLIAPLM